jgi:protein TilB
MPLITQELLRKKSEHNEGVLQTLEEVSSNTVIDNFQELIHREPILIDLIPEFQISLHQLDIEKISNLDVYCRHLRILYLQDNIIERMEGLSKLKELEYINLAVNSVSLVEGVRGCESLQKLDLTLNFVDLEDLEESMDNLAELPDFRELYIIGNPCCDWEHYKDYIVARLPELGRLDGDEVTKSWKLRAAQNLEQMTKELTSAARKNIEKKVLEEREGTKDPNAYSKEWRRESYEEKVAEEKAKAEKSKQNSMFKEYHELQEEHKPRPIPVYGKDGRIRQANQGKYEWRYDETPDKTCVVFEIKIPKYLDTQLIDLDLQPEYVRLDIKGRIT